MAAIPGLRGTGEFGTDIRPTNYRELYTLLEPNGTAPLNALLAMAQSEVTDDPKFSHFRDELPDRTMVIDNGGGYDSSTNTLNFTSADDLSYVIKGSVIVNSRTGEVMHATDAPTSTTLKVTRNIGATTHTINDGDELFVAGFAMQEGGSGATALSFDPTVDFNYTQIFKTAYQVSGTLQHTYRRIGPAEDEYATKALKLHMSDLERAMLFGKRAIVNSTTASPTRYTGGVTTMITNVIDVSAAQTQYTMTENEFDELLIKTIFAYGSKTKIALVGAQVAAHMQRFGKDRWQPTQINSGTYGVSFTRYGTFAGDLMVQVHPQFRQIEDMQYAMLILDLPYLRYRYLEGRDTHLQENIQAPDEDAVKHQYLTECGLEMTQSKVHAYIKNWKYIST